MKRLFLALAVLAIGTPALAQQPPSTALDRVSTSFGVCIGKLEFASDEARDLRKALAEAQARVKELEAKAEPAKPDPKPSPPAEVPPQ